MADRRLTIIPDKRLTILPQARQIIPIAGAILALTWGISKALTSVRKRRTIAARRVIYRRLTIILEPVSHRE